MYIIWFEKHCSDTITVGIIWCNNLIVIALVQQHEMKLTLNAYISRFLSKMFVKKIYSVIYIFFKIALHFNNFNNWNYTQMF